MKNGVIRSIGASEFLRVFTTLSVSFLLHNCTRLDPGIYTGKFAGNNAGNSAGIFTERIHHNGLFVNRVAQFSWLEIFVYNISVKL